MAEAPSTPSTSSTTSARPGVLNVALKDKAMLYASYMPFINNGGLFIPTSREYEMGQEVFILLSLMDEAERLPVAGKVIWKTPPNSEAHRVVGIGVQLSDKDNGTARNKIEAYLAGALGSERPTHTM